MLLPLLLGCEEKPVVVVNNEGIMEKEVGWHIQERLKEHQASGIQVNPADIRHTVLLQMISQKLLAQGAMENEIIVSDEEISQLVSSERKRIGEKEFKRALQEASISEKEYEKMTTERILSEKFVNFLVPGNAVTEEEIKAYYKNSPKPFLMPEMVLVRFIHTPTEEKANALLERMKKSNFDEVADSLAGDRNYSVSSGYGWTNPKIYSPGIAQGIGGIKAGEHSEPLKGRQGFFIFRVKEKKAEGVKTLDEAREEIRSILIKQKRGTAIIHWVAERKKASSIKMD
jgi:parvulin-like peptidyl-prolyl isomerase